MYVHHFILDLLANFLDFFTMELFALTGFRYQHPFQKTWCRSLFIVINLVIAAVPVIPYIPLVYMILCFFYFFFVSSFRAKESFLFWVKYEIIIHLVQFGAYVFTASFNLKMYAEGNDPSLPFFEYQAVTSLLLTYILLNLYMNARRLKSLRIKTVYPVTFSLLSIGILFLVIFFNNMLSPFAELSTILPWLYLSVVCILSLALNSYGKIIEILEERMKESLLTDKYQMELSYFGDIQKSLEHISRLRHDFKNHLIVLDSYAAQNQTQKLRGYLSQITSELEISRLICTPDDLISSILNTKNAVCQRLHITFEVICDFPDRYFSDFAAITILGNILDNAITAAAEAKDRQIKLSLLQADYYLAISCTNTHSGAIHEKNGVFLSTKTDTSSVHGLGIGNVRKCITDLNGTLDIRYTDQEFTMDILIPNRPTG